MAPGDEVDRDHVRDQCDIGVFGSRRFQRPLDRMAGSVGDMNDSAMAVPALSRQMQRVAFLGERHTEIDQMPNCAWRSLDHVFDDVAIVEPRAGNHRIFDMRFEAVAFLEHRGDAALCPARGALAKRALGDHRNLARFRKVERRRQTSCARADDEDVGVDAHAASRSAAVRLRNTSSRSGSRVETSTMVSPAAVKPASTWPAFV